MRFFTGLLLGCEWKNNIFGVNSASHGPKILPRSESSRVGTGIPTGSPEASTSPRLPFSTLFAAIINKVPAEDMKLIHMYHLHFRAKKMTRDDFLKKLRSVVGDDLLRATLPGLLQHKISSKSSCVIKMES